MGIIAAHKKIPPDLKPLPLYMLAASNIIRILPTSFPED
jgi:hypothetical protein